MKIYMVIEELYDNMSLGDFTTTRGEIIKIGTNKDVIYDYFVNKRDEDLKKYFNEEEIEILFNETEVETEDGVQGFYYADDTYIILGEEASIKCWFIEKDMEV